MPEHLRNAVALTCDWREMNAGPSYGPMLQLMRLSLQEIRPKLRLFRRRA